MIRAHQPGSEPIDIPETIPNPVVVPKPTTPTEPAPKEPVRIPERVPGQHELPAARDGAGNPIEVVGAWSEVTARKQLAEALAAQERLVHLLTGSGAPMADRPSGRSHRN